MPGPAELTKQSDVFNLPAPADGEAVYFDRGKAKDQVLGLALRVRAAGSRRWVFYYRFAGKQKRLGIGDAGAQSLEDARKVARKHRVALDNSEDPAVEKATKRAASGLTVGSVAEHYLEARRTAMKPRSHAECARHLRKAWKSLHGVALASVTRAMVAEGIRGITNRNGPRAANTARSTLSTMYSWAIGEGLCEQNPVDGTNKADEGGSRDRVLSDAELASVWKSAPESDYGRIVRLLILTGQRREEIASLCWSEVDLDTKTINLPATRTKNGRPHDVPLSALALDILAKQPHIIGRDLVFGAGEGGFSGWSKAKEALDETVKLKDGWTLHDLRRTFATRMADLGVQPHVIEAILNHVSGHKAGVAGIYNRSTYAAEKRAALDVWATHLQTIVAQSKGANVVKMRKARTR